MNQNYKELTFLLINEYYKIMGKTEENIRFHKHLLNIVDISVLPDRWIYDSIRLEIEDRESEIDQVDFFLNNRK